MFNFIRNLFLPKELIQKIVDEAKQGAREIVLKANEDAVAMRHQAEIDARRITADAVQIEKDLNKVRSQIGQEKAEVSKDKQFIEDEKKKILAQNTQIDDIRKELEERKEALLTKLEHVAQLTKDQAKDLILNGVEER